MTKFARMGSRPRMAGGMRVGAARPRRSYAVVGGRAVNCLDRMGQQSTAEAFMRSVRRSERSSGSAGQRGRTTMMFERFTEKAIKVVMLAQEESRRLGHNFVGTEQILLGLIGESTGISAKVLKSMGVTLKEARTEVEKVIGRGSGFVAVEIPFTPRAKRVLELSLDEARQLGALWRQGRYSAGAWWKRAASSLHHLCRPQLYWHRAHPAGPVARR